jgi:hypothetical protein
MYVYMYMCAHTSFDATCVHALKGKRAEGMQHMYMCVRICMCSVYVRIYVCGVCICVCSYVNIYRHDHVCAYVQGLLEGSAKWRIMYVCMSVCMCVCVCVCIC